MSLTFNSYTQEQGENKKVKVQPDFLFRNYNKKKPVILTFTVDPKNLKHYKEENKISVTILDDLSTLTSKDYRVATNITNSSVTANNGNHELLIILSPNSQNETAKKVLTFKIDIRDQNNAHVDTSNVHLTITTENDSIDNFRYLAYIGTNFDLVDGIKAKNLFFATNIFIPPNDIETMGFYISLYGNRTSTYNDSIGNYRTSLKAIRRDASDSLYAVFEQSDLLIESHSDNLGVYVSPLLRLWKQKRNFQVYYTPSLEFVWRRNIQNLTHVNGRELRPNYTADEIQQYGVETELASVTKQILSNNIYDWNLGLVGLFLNHESDRISVRLNMNVGPCWRYESAASNRSDGMTRGGELIAPVVDESTDWFFSGKLWITERYSGITLQAEVTNNIDVSNPYYGVTLSKAIDFGKLATIFQPISR